MKWLPENLFRHQFVRPKKNFRYCYTKNCESGKRRLHVVDTNYNGRTYKEVLEWCNCCYNEDDDYSITIPAYLIDYNLLLATHSELNNPSFLNHCDENVLKRKIEYYIMLKKIVSKDPYFRHLKRVKNRHLLRKHKK